LAIQISGSFPLEFLWGIGHVLTHPHAGTFS
jgi:hypothetical protein